MPLFAHYFPKATRLEQWLTTIRSMRTILLGTRRSQQSSEAQSRQRGSNRSAEAALGGEPGVYVELGARKPSTGENSAFSGNQGREWPDREGAVQTTVNGHNV